MVASGGSLYNTTREILLASNAESAATIWARFRGLMLRSHFPAGSALIIDPCSSIHMFFMRFPIDVLYLDRGDHVVRVQEHVKPWRVGPLWTRSARYVIELPAGTVARTNTSVGDRIDRSRPA